MKNILVTILFLLCGTISTATGSKNEVSKEFSENEWPSQGPWIIKVSYGENENFITRARLKHAYIMKGFEANRNLKPEQLLVVKNSIIDPRGLNAVVIKGLNKSVLLSIAGSVGVYPDLPVHPAAYSWGLYRIEKPTLPLSSIYNPPFQGCGVDIYVLDSGIDTNHIEFSPVSGVNRTVANIFNQFGPISSNTDGFGHGTHCAGTAGGNTIGVAPCANIYGLKIFDNNGGSSLSSTILSALSVVKQRHLSHPSAKSVVTMSLSGSCSSILSCSNNLINQMIANMYQVGILFAVPAGNNNGKNACLYFPSSSSAAVTVAASDQFDNLASYSSGGPCVDLISPGSAIISACSKGTYCSDESTYLAFSGTSMAAAHVAGALAQLLQAWPLPLSPSSSPPDALKATLFCLAAQGQLLGVFNQSFGMMPNLLLQVPANSGSCFPTSEPTATPSNSPAQLIQPTLTSTPRSPSVQPFTKPSTIPSTTIPSVTLTCSPSFRKPSNSPSFETGKPTSTGSSSPFVLASITPSVSPTTKSDTSDLICQDGGFCRSSSDCFPGNKCVGQFPSYTKCQADPSTYSVDPTCLANWDLPCTTDGQCCDPGAFCGTGPFRACQQPSLTSGLCQNPFNFPTSQPASVPPTTLRKDYSQLICRNGGFCLSATDCVPGNKCVGQFPGYTSCQADPTTYRSDGVCLSDFGQVCIDDSQCCDPGSVCLGNGQSSTKFCQQLSYTSGLCLNPEAFPTSQPVSLAPTPSRKDFSHLICRNGGFCLSSSDCVPGNKCVGQYPGYSSCQADTSTYRSDGVCLSDFGQVCTNDWQCCDPGSVCLGVGISVCQQLSYTSGLCLNPSRFVLPSPTAVSSIVPSVRPSYPSSATPSGAPYPEPTVKPKPIKVTSRRPSVCPSYLPSFCPSFVSSNAPKSSLPSICPSSIPSVRRSVTPTSVQPSQIPSAKPSNFPSISPTVKITKIPSVCPSRVPTNGPTLTPSKKPSMVPSNSLKSKCPSRIPSISPVHPSVLKVSFVCSTRSPQCPSVTSPPSGPIYSNNQSVSPLPSTIEPSQGSFVQ